MTLNYDELESFSVQELTLDSLENVKGGWWQAGLALLGAAIYLYNNSGDFVDGFKDGLAAYKAQQ
ncbi:MAG: hypothetical protein K2U26_07065 [Cyclobacteriaceae bacterium]|nr:hypothetical protein [Cyclobacteriaceae bacterium]